MPAIKSNQSPIQFAANGFSIVELIVVMAIFSTVLLVITDIYVNVTRNQQRLMEFQQAQAELRGAVNIISDMVKNGRLVYDMAAYGGSIELPENVLALTVADGQTNRIAIGEAACASGAHRLYFGESALTGCGLDITRADFYITPAADPYLYNEITGAYAADQQPSVTLILSGQTVPANGLNARAITVQTTITQRYYER